ncbi:response regulator [Methylobacterium currus]|jgi:CheY-like chemotaxis protein|nr:response regulator [Methylobacterium currus]UHC17594.1 response regulator [Methylobacterium currus]
MKRASPPLIMLVEEEADEREAISRLLRESGFAVVSAPTTDSALAYLTAHPAVQGLVVDAHEPGAFDGHELARRVRTALPQIAVVVTSGHSDDPSWSPPDGAEFLLKPDLVTELPATLHRLIGADARGAA